MGFGLRCRAPDAGCRVWGAGCRVQGAGCRVQGAGCRVQGAGVRGYHLDERVVREIPEAHGAVGRAGQ